MNILERDGKEGVPPGFLELPALVYAGEPNWIPEEPGSIEAQFNGQNDYFGYGQARTFCIPGVVRAAVFHEPALRIDGETVAFFGYFESTGDAEANRALMARVEAWSRERGAQRLYGPIQFNTLTGYRLRLEAEPGALPFLGEPQNPATYPALLQDLGFALHQKYVTQLIPFAAAQLGLKMVEPIYKGLLAQGYVFHTPSPELWAKSLPELYEMVDTIFSQNFAYSRLSYPYFARVFESTLLRRIDPESSMVVTAPTGETVGFGLAYPHYGHLTVQARGAERVAARDLDYATHWPLIAQTSPRACIGKTMGVHPAHRRKGIMEAMIYYSFMRAHSRYDVWFGALIREDNHSRKTFALLQSGERVYGLYAKVLEG